MAEREGLTIPNVPLTFDLPHGDVTPQNLARTWGRQWTLVAQVLNAALKTDVAANRASSPIFDESLFYASDTGVTSIGVSGAWQLLAGLTGTVTSVSTNYTVAATDATVLVDATGGAKTITVPQGANYKGRVWAVKKTDSSANAVTVSPASGNIDGAASKALSTQYNSVIITSDGTNYWILGQV